jgi:hypothetical protein
MHTFLTLPLVVDEDCGRRSRVGDFKIYLLEKLANENARFYITLT